MPLSAVEIPYLNTLLDKKLKNDRSWPWVRFVALAMGVVSITMGIWLGSIARPMARTAWNLPEEPSPATQDVSPTSTQPVTQEQFRTALESARGLAALDARMTSMLTALSIMAFVGSMFMCFMGMQVLGYPLSRWNHHRRDAILIKLLREKLAAELTAPS